MCIRDSKEQLAGSGISSFSELRSALDPKLSVSGEAYETEDEECLNLTLSLIHIWVWRALWRA